MAKPIRSKTKVFEYILQENKPGAKYDFILMHGFGADCGDLFGLYPYLQNLPIKRFIFPEGVIAANGVPTGRAWFPIDIQALERAMMTGSHRSMSGPIPPAVTKLSQSIESSLIDELGIVPENTIIGGFSQGSMMSVNMFLNSTHNYKALVQLSGTFLDRENWEQKIKQKNKCPIFVSHGVNDALLNPKDADDLAKCFHEAGYPLSYEIFQGGHEIPIEVLNQLNSFITKL